MMRLQPVLSSHCTGCKASMHQYPSRSDLTVTGNCGENCAMGSCVGIIYYPVKNPKAGLHERLESVVRGTAQ